MDTSQQGFFLGPDDNPDKYRLLAQFGAGGEAQLWRATLTLAGASEPVAVKVLRAERQADFAELSRRWSEQAELLRFLAHPGVVQVREHFEGAPVHAFGQAAQSPGRPLGGTEAGGAGGVGRTLCLVMNCVDGLSLRDWIVLNPGPEGVLRGLRHLEQVAEVLDWLHSGQATPSGRVIVHGDLSPGNVMVDANGQAVLVDFGLARLAGHRTTRPAFTPGYAAPEVWNAGEYTPAADRYGFGAIGYFLLTGENPPPDPGRIRADLAALPLVAGGGQQRLDTLGRIFDPNPAVRPSALEWVQALRDGATTAARRGTRSVPPTHVPTTPVAEPPTESFAAVPVWAGAAAHAGPSTSVGPPVQVSAPAPPQRRGRWKVVAVAGLVVVALAVAGGVVLGGRLLGGSGTEPGPVAAADPSTTPAAAPTTTTRATTTTTTPPTLSPGAGGPTTAPVGSGAITYLADLDPILGYWFGSGTLAVDGRTYTHSLNQACNLDDPREIEYDLGRRYTSFEALAGMSDLTDSAAVAQLEFFRDGLPVGEARVQRGTTQPIAFDVTGALTLKVTVSTIERGRCSGSGAGPTLADPRLAS